MANIRETVLGFLTSQLKDETDAGRAAWALVQLQAEGPVIAALTNANAIIRTSAILALDRESVSEAAVAPLIADLQSADFDSRRFAISALARIHKQPEVVVPALEALLSDSNYYIRYYTACALNEFKIPAKTLLPFFFESLSSTNAS